MRQMHTRMVERGGLKMAEYIDKKGALDILRKAENANYGNLDVTRVINECIIDIMRLKVADVHPVRRGKWLYSDEYITTAYGTIHFSKCSVCNTAIAEIDDYDNDFCPYCGARMDGDTE